MVAGIAAATQKTAESGAEGAAGILGKASGLMNFK